MEIVVRHPAAEVEQPRRKDVQNVDHVLETRDIGIGKSDNRPGHAPAAEGHEHAAAGDEAFFHLPGGAVMKGLVNGCGNGYIDDEVGHEKKDP